MILYGIVLKRLCIELHYWRIEKIQHVYCERQAYKNSPVRIAATIFLVRAESNRLHQSQQRIQRQPFHQHHQTPNKLIPARKSRSHHLHHLRWRKLFIVFTTIFCFQRFFLRFDTKLVPLIRLFQ